MSLGVLALAEHYSPARQRSRVETHFAFLERARMDQSIDMLSSGSCVACLKMKECPLFEQLNFAERNTSIVVSSGSPLVKLSCALTIPSLAIKIAERFEDLPA